MLKCDATRETREALKSSTHPASPAWWPRDVVTVQAAEQRALWGKEQNKAAKAAADITTFFVLIARFTTCLKKRGSPVSIKH